MEPRKLEHKVGKSKALMERISKSTKRVGRKADNNKQKTNKCENQIGRQIHKTKTKIIEAIRKRERENGNPGLGGNDQTKK